MTNSSDKPSQSKTKGPIRYEAIIPFCIFCTLVGVYFVLFFDTHLRWGIEKALSSLNGAEVNVGSLRTSFLNASLDIRNIEVTNYQNPKTNLIQIGQIKFKALWDGLLRGKIVINEASINGIAINTLRKNVGRVYPKSLADEAQPSKVDQTISRAAKKYEGNIFGDIAATMQGKGQKNQIEVVADQLKANIKSKQLQTELKLKETEWKKRIETLPKPKEVETLVQRLKEIKFSGKNPTEIVATIQEAQSLIKEIENKINQYKSTSSDLQNDINKFSEEIKNLEKLVQEDIDDLKARLQIPNLKANNIAQLLFGDEIEKRLKQVKDFKSKYEKFLPAQKSKDKKTQAPLVAHQRAKGQNYQFGRPKAYPLFWLKKAQISSVATEDGFSGNITGVLLNLSSDPKNLGHPMELKFEGSFPKQKILGLLGKITLDMSKSEALVNFNGKVDSFPIENKILADTQEVKFGLEKALGHTELEGTLVANNLQMEIKNKYREINYSIAAKNHFVNDVLKSVAQDTPILTLNATVSGDLLQPQIGLNSNLGEAISSGFRKQIDLKVKQIQQQVQTTVENAIKHEKEKLTQQFDHLKAQYFGEIEKQKNELEKQKQMAQSKVDEGKKSQEDQAKKLLEQKGQQVLDDLKKKFKF